MERQKRSLLNLFSLLILVNGGLNNEISKANCILFKRDPTASPMGFFWVA